MKLSIGVSVLGVVFAAISAGSAPKTDWNSLKALTSGAELRITTTGNQPFRGQFNSVSDGSLVITRSGNLETLDRTSVAGVSLKGQNHRKRNLLIGLVVGAAAGLGAGIGADASDRCKPGVFCLDIGGPNLGKEIFTPVGAIVGLGVGALIPTGGWRVVYSSR
jgi:hypothetical protein